MKELIEGLQILEKYADTSRPIVLYRNYIYVDVQNVLWDELCREEGEKLQELGFEPRSGLKSFRIATV
jgi:hypothetical protein